MLFWGGSRGATPYCLWDLSSRARGQTLAPCSGDLTIGLPRIPKPVFFSSTIAEVTQHPVVFVVPDPFLLVLPIHHWGVPGWLRSIPREKKSHYGTKGQICFQGRSACEEQPRHLDLMHTGLEARASSDQVPGSRPSPYSSSCRDS